MVPRKPAKFENPGQNFSEVSFVIYSRKTGKYLNQNIFTGNWPGIVWMKYYLSNFDSIPLTCDLTVFPDKDFILTYLDSSMAEVFPHFCLFFLILTIFRRRRGVKVGPKVLILRPSLFHKYLNPSKNFQAMFLFASILPLAKMLAILDHIGGVRTHKPPKKDYFVDAKSVRKTLEIFNLTTKNSIQMKLTTIIYLHESVNRKAIRVKNSFFWLNLIASPVKILYKFDDIWEIIPWKTTQNRF